MVQVKEANSRNAEDAIHQNSLVPLELDRLDTVSGAEDDCVEVKVYKEAR